MEHTTKIIHKQEGHMTPDEVRDKLDEMIQKLGNSFEAPRVTHLGVDASTRHDCVITVMYLAVEEGD